MGTCYSVDEVVVDLPSGSPVKCDDSAETASVVADKDSTTNKRGHDDNVGLLVKKLSAKAIATNAPKQQPASSRPRRSSRRGSGRRRRTSLDSLASALSGVESINECIVEFLDRTRRMSSHLMHRRSSAVKPSSEDDSRRPRQGIQSVTMESILGNDEYCYEVPIHD